MLGKDTELKTIFTIISKNQFSRLQKIASMRKISKAKLIRHIIEDYLKRLLVLGTDL
jgi:hypothetical protein